MHSHAKNEYDIEVKTDVPFHRRRNLYRSEKLEILISRQFNRTPNINGSTHMDLAKEFSARALLEK